MKRILALLVIITLAGSNDIFAQSDAGKIKYGVRAGVNAAYHGFSNAYKKDAKDDGYSNRPVVSFHAGGYVDYMLTNAISIQGGLLLTGKGGKENWAGEDPFSGNDSKGGVREHTLYLEIPVNAVYKIGKFYAGAGPYLGYALSGKWKEWYDEYEEDGEVISDDESGKIVFSGENAYRKRLDAGANIMAGYQITDHINVGLNFGIGLMNVNKTEYQADEHRKYWSLKNRVFAVSVGYTF